MTGWKTVFFGALLAVFGALQGLDWVALLPSNAQLAGWIISGVGVIVVILRALTNTPVGTK